MTSLRVSTTSWRTSPKSKPSGGTSTTSEAGTVGGEVVSGPLDAPWSRVVEIKDPHGATFIASQFVPENSELET